MKYVIVILLAFAVSFFFGMVLGIVSSDDDPLDDKAQEEYLRKWSEKRRYKR